MALGTAWSIGNYALLAGMTVLFAAIYHFIILDEETKLVRIFGEPYDKYRAAVPRFFPRPWPARSEVLDQVNPELDHHRFSLDIATKNKAMEAYYSFAGLIGFVALVALAWQRWGTT
jgi:hypothetical protein